MTVIWKLGLTFLLASLPYTFWICLLSQPPITLAIFLDNSLTMSTLLVLWGTLSDTVLVPLDPAVL